MYHIKDSEPFFVSLNCKTKCNFFLDFYFTKQIKCAKIHTVEINGALAQLGAHHTGSVGVRGSSPLCSIKRQSTFWWIVFYEIK